MFISSVSLISSNLQLNNFTFENLEQLELDSESIMSLSEDSKINSDSIHVTLHFSELYFDDSVDISSSNVILIAVNSHFQNDFDFASIHILDLSFSTFESVSSTHTIVAYFSCFHCQILGTSPLSVETYSEINSGNFSSSFIVQESVDNSSITGRIQLANSFDFFSHVILDDVSVSEFQSSSGSITCHSDVLMKNFVTLSTTTFNSVAGIILSDANVILEQNLELSEFQILRGLGTVFNNTSNAGKLIPLPLIAFDDILALLPSSIVSIQINSGDSFTQLIIGSTAYLDGILEIEFETMYDSTGNNYTIIESGLINGKFHDVISPCNSLITAIYSETSLVVSINDNVLDLNQVSYISTTGVDDPCCGTFDSPCASFNRVVDRMGTKGTVYFHSGIYTFKNGLGDVNDVDWQLIGLGDVVIDGIYQTFSEVLHSKFSLSNIDIVCHSPSCFTFDDSIIQLINSNIFHEAGSTTILTDTSTVFLSNCSFESNSSSLLRSSNSQLILQNVSVSGSFTDSPFVLDNTPLDISYSTFLNINSSSLFQLTKSNITLSYSFCSNSNFSYVVFDLVESQIIENGLSFESVTTSIIFSINSSVFIMDRFTVSSSIKIDQLLSANDAEIVLIDFNLFSIDSSSAIIFVSNSKIDLQTFVFQDINCKSLIESSNGPVELNELTISTVTCDTCFDILRGTVFITDMDIFDTTGSLIELMEVNLLDINF
ncbi:hypothetical protein GEMRC1_008635 [Eukaryota sp. GEM-RC1]